MFSKTNNKALPILNVSEVQQKLFDFDDSGRENRNNGQRNDLRKSNDFQSKLDVGNYKHPEIKISDEYANKYFMDENGIIHSLNPICPHCNSHNVVKWSFYGRKVISEEYCGEIIIRRYYCKKCNKTFMTDLKDQFDFHSNISNGLKEKALKIKELNWSSLRDISKYYKIFNNIDISYETVRKALIVVDGNEINYQIGALSGYYGYDAQWVKINKKWKFRHAVYDIVRKMPIAELFSDEDTNKDVYYLINKYIELKDRTCIVTDTKKGYDKVMRKLKFKRHQYCTFHFKLNLNKKVHDEILKYKRKIESELKKTYKNETKTFIENKVKEELKPIKKEMGYILQLIYYLFKEESFEKANSYINLIKTNMVNFPDFIREYIVEYFFPHYKSYLYYLEKPYKGKLDRTNNKTEGYFRATMPKGQKRKFRTLNGLVNQVYHRGNGLINNQIEKEEKLKNSNPSRFIR